MIHPGLSILKIFNRYIQQGGCCQRDVLCILITTILSVSGQMCAHVTSYYPHPPFFSTPLPEQFSETASWGGCCLSSPAILLARGHSLPSRETAPSYVFSHHQPTCCRGVAPAAIQDNAICRLCHPAAIFCLHSILIAIVLNFVSTAARL